MRSDLRYATTCDASLRRVATLLMVRERFFMCVALRRLVSIPMLNRVDVVFSMKDDEKAEQLIILVNVELYDMGDKQYSNLDLNI